MKRSKEQTSTPSLPNDLESSPVKSAIEKYADNPSAFLALNDGNETFSVPGTEGVIVYRGAGRYLIQFGGVFAPEEQRAELLRAFREFAAHKRRRVVAMQLQAADTGLYESEGFVINQVGASYSVNLADFSLRGSKFVKLRNKISRAGRSGLEVREVDFDGYRDQLAEVDGNWLRSKGRHVKEIEFLVGQLGGPAQKHRRLFVGLLEGAPIAYISYSPSYGSTPGWLHDLSRRIADPPPGVMEALNSTAMGVFREEGAQWLHFGFTPFTTLRPEHERESHSPVTAKFMKFLAEHGESVYPSRSQLAYKEKWGPHLVLPEYLAFEGRVRPGAIWQILRVTKSI
ncbi:bifunctional lysylphosphatidylglycerol flippase/synthetase MprF [Streptomyces sp. SYP-A7185]|uniref:bifunctional lysylphosphatidylglycerol flippase/synthetase MprF n=1 Tax=Streptomyces sp. SYP-A7185 TaxID=3040076 RepID=UPI0038F77F9C